MLRALSAFVLLTALVAVPPAGAATGPAGDTGSGTGVGTVSTPRVGFDPLFAPWRVRRVAQETGDRRTVTALSLADGGTPESGRGFALVRTRAVAGAELCGASTTPRTADRAARTGGPRAER